MAKLSKKAKEKLDSLKGVVKMQQAGMVGVPYQDYDMNFDYSQEIGLSPQMKTLQPNEGLVQIQNQGKGFDMPSLDALGSGISSVVKLGTGIAGIIQGAQEKKRQRAFEKNARKDYLKRMEEARANNFYMTPYTTGRTSDLTLKKGGKVYQQGGNVDLFMQFYNNQQANLQNSLNQLQDYYEDKNQTLKTQWQQKKSKGISDTISGAFDLGKALLAMQEGGSIPDNSAILSSMLKTNTLQQIPLSQEETRFDEQRLKLLSNKRSDDRLSITWNLIGEEGNRKSKSRDRFREKQEGGEIDQLDTESLYSADFRSPWENKELIEQTENNIKTEDPFFGVETKQIFQDWLFEQEEPKDYFESNQYFDIYGQHSEEQLPIQPVLDRLTQMGLKPSNVNEGKHNVGSRHYSGRALDLGLNTSFGGDQSKMDAFYNFLTSPEGRQMFPEVHVRDERTKPEGQKVWSSPHIHIELKN